MLNDYLLRGPKWLDIQYLPVDESIKQYIIELKSIDGEPLRWVVELCLTLRESTGSVKWKISSEETSLND